MIPRVSWLLLHWVAVGNSLLRAPAVLLRAMTVLLWQAGDTLLWPARLVLCGSTKHRGNSCGGWGTSFVQSWWCLCLWSTLVWWVLSLKRWDRSLAVTCHEIIYVRIFMPVQFPFLQLLTRHSAALGMRNNLQCSAHLQKNSKQINKLWAGVLDQEWEHTVRWTRCPFTQQCGLLVMYMWVQFHH